MEYTAIEPAVRAFLEEAERISVLSPAEQAALCTRRAQGDRTAGEALLQAQYPMLGNLIQHLPRDLRTPELTERLLTRLREITETFDFCTDEGFGRVFSREMRAVVGEWMRETAK